MTLEEIKAAVDAGKIVHWSNERYTVIKDKWGNYLIVCGNGYATGLTDSNGAMNELPELFYVE